MADHEYFTGLGAVIGLLLGILRREVATAGILP